MRFRLFTPVAWTFAALLAISLLAAAKDKSFVMPRAFHAKTYPAHEEHPKEKVSIAGDPYDLPEKAAIFIVKYRKHELLPLHVIISNDGGAPVVLTDMRVQLITAGGVKINPSTPNDIFRRIGRRPRGPRVPLPIPQRPRGSIKEEEFDEIENSQFRARAVEPGRTQAGFMFFDVSGIKQPLAGAHLYVTGLRNAEGEELFFFEVPLEKYLTYQPGK